MQIVFLCSGFSGCYTRDYVGTVLPNIASIQYISIEKETKRGWEREECRYELWFLVPPQEKREHTSCSSDAILYRGSCYTPASAPAPASVPAVAADGASSNGVGVGAAACNPRFAERTSHTVAHGQHGQPGMLLITCYAIPW